MSRNDIYPNFAGFLIGMGKISIFILSSFHFWNISRTSSSFLSVANPVTTSILREISQYFIFGIVLLCSFCATSVGKEIRIC